MPYRKLLLYPLVFGIIGALIGLVLRLAFTGSITIPYKNVLHAHSHVMLLGLIFNALFLLVWKNFAKEIDRKTSSIFIVLQVLMLAMVIAFIYQGYALFSIVFSTLHLWTSYWLCIRLWKRVDRSKTLIKIGIVFHFVSSLGPYALGPLMALKMQGSPWYQQAIFFYLHFQFFGVYFTWLMTLLAKTINIKWSKQTVIVLCLAQILLYAHTLSYSFENGVLPILGAIGAVLLLTVLFGLRKQIRKANKQFKLLYGLLLLVGIANLIGSLPTVSTMVVQNRFVLIAWLHFLFLGLYLPFIWIQISKVTKVQGVVYGLFFAITEVLLLFPNQLSNLLTINHAWLLFISYFVLILIFVQIHINTIRKLLKNKDEITSSST